MIRLLKGFAAIWATLVGLVVLIGYGSILVNEGFGRLQEIASPFNIVNYLVILLALSPALGAWALADKLEKRDRSDSL